MKARKCRPSAPQTSMTKGFPRKAKLVYLMVISEYDLDNAAAHKALGEVTGKRVKFPGTYDEKAREKLMKGLFER